MDRIKRLIILCGIVCFYSLVCGQQPAKYWVAFSDKSGSIYNINKPEEFLSAKAIERRIRYNIPITEEDFPVNQSYISKILSLDTSIILFTQSKWLNGITIYCKDTILIEKIKAFPFVRECQRSIKLKDTENRYDSVYQYIPKQISTQKHEAIDFKNLSYGKSASQLKINNIHWLHRMGFLGKEMFLTVQDGGFHNVDSIVYFERLREENRLLGVRNFVQPDKNPMRAHSHGTMVLSCIASYLPDELVGSAPEVSVYLSQTEDGRSENLIEEDNWIAGLEWADSLGCDILNSSLGYTLFDDNTQNHQWYQLNGQYSRASRAASIAAKKGMIVCNSAGNSGDDKWKYIGVPADAKDILTIGGVQGDRKKSSFSSYGYFAGGNIKPDACGVASFTWVASPNGKTVFAFGTSFSSPLVAGMVACLWQACREKNAFEIMEAVRKSGHQYKNPTEALGYGITDFFKAYNLLKNKSAIFNEQEKLILQPDFDNFVIKNGQLHFTLNSQLKTMVVITIENDKQKVIYNQKYTIKKSKKINLKNIHLMEENQLYAFGKLQISIDNNPIFTYTIGEER